ncbi:MAG: hypothetical protein LBT02_03755 [Rickettsiales bacterium]|jgi:tetratricopeptide (TPR) repeat protein|nr:hypothetical protein [Rickettsiales bacterium]
MVFLKKISKKSLILFVFFFVIVVFGFSFYNYIVSLTLTNENVKIKETLINNFDREKYVEQVLNNNKITFKKQRLQEHILVNFEHFLKHVELEKSISYYVKLYNESFKILKQLKKESDMANKDYLEAKKYISKLDFYRFFIKIDYINFKKNSNDVLATKNYLIGLIKELNFEYFEANDFYKKAIALNPYVNVYYIRLGNIFFNEYDFNKTISIYELGLYKANFTTQSDKKIKLQFLDNIGEMYYLKGEFDKSLRYYNELLLQALNYNNNDQKYNAIFNIGLINIKKIDYKNAIDTFVYAYKVAFKNNNMEQKFNSMLMLAEVYRLYGDYENGKFYAIKSFELAKKLKNLSYLASSAFSACANYEQLEKKDLSKIYCDRNIRINEVLTSIVGRPEYFIQIGKVYKTIYNSSEKRNEYLETALKIAKNYILKLNELTIYDLNEKDSEYLKLKEELQLKENGCSYCKNVDIKLRDGNIREAMKYLEEIIEKVETNYDRGRFALLLARLQNIDGNIILANKYGKIALESYEKVYKEGHKQIEYVRKFLLDLEKEV